MLKWISSSECFDQGQAAVLPEEKSSTANVGTIVPVLLAMNRCGSFPLLVAPHSPFGISSDLKRSENIPGAPREGEESGFD